MDKLIKFFCLMILLLGLGLVSGGVYFLTDHANFMETADTIEATVTKVTRYGSGSDKRYDIYVSFEYDGILYEDVFMDMERYSMSEGKKIEVLCDPTNPKDVRNDDDIKLFGILFSLIGSVLTLIGIFSLTVSIKNSRRKKRLLENGRILYATVDKIDFDYAYTVNGDHPYLIYCSYKDEFTGKVYKFKSKITWKDPSEIFPIGSFIQVLVDSNDYTKYYVKLEEIMDQRANSYT